MSILVAGVDFSGAKTEPNETWLVVSELSSLGMQVKSVKRTGSQGLEKNSMPQATSRWSPSTFPSRCPLNFCVF